MVMVGFGPMSGANWAYISVCLYIMWLPCMTSQRHTVGGHKLTECVIVGLPPLVPVI